MYQDQDIAPMKNRKQGLVEALGGTAQGPLPDNNTGIAGAGGLQAAPEPAPAIQAAPKSTSPFQSQNQSVRGYLDEAAHAFAPTVKGIKDEAGRKSAVEQYLQSLAPEVQQRGGSISGIKGEKANVDGRILDFYRDIEGAADPQLLDITDERPAMAPQRGGIFAGSTIGGALQGDAQSNIQAALGQMGGSQDDSMIQRLIAQLRGGGQ